MRILGVWAIEFIKLLARRRLHPLNAECPICHQMVRLHCNKAGRRHLFAHARAYSRTLYEGSRYGALCGENKMFRLRRAGEVRSAAE